MTDRLGPFKTNLVCEGDCLELIPQLPDGSLDIVVTSPPYWGQRTSMGIGVEEDPRLPQLPHSGLWTAYSKAAG